MRLEVFDLMAASASRIALGKCAPEQRRELMALESYVLLIMRLAELDEGDVRRILECEHDADAIADASPTVIAMCLVFVELLAECSALVDHPVPSVRRCIEGIIDIVRDEARDAIAPLDCASWEKLISRIRTALDSIPSGEEQTVAKLLELGRVDEALGNLAQSISSENRVDTAS